MLAKHAALVADRDAVRRALRALRACVDERDALVDEAAAGGRAVTQLARYGPWRARARAARTNARQVRDDGARRGVDSRAFSAGYERLRARLRALERALDYDAASQALLAKLPGQVGTADSPFGPEPLDDADIESARTHARAETRPGELPPLVATFIASRDAVQGVREALHRCDTQRAARLAEALEAARAVTQLDAHASWRDDTRQALARWRALRTEAARYRAHGQALDGGWEGLVRTASALERAIDLDALGEGLAEDWRTHVRGATAHGVEPFDHEGCDALLARLRAFAEAATPRGEVPPWLAGALTRHDAWTADRAAVRAAEDALARCVRERETLLAEARRTRHALTDLPAHDAWRVRAEAALTGARALLAEEGRCRAHLGETEARWERFMRNGARVKRALGTDRRAGALLRDWHEHEARASARGIASFYREGYRDLMWRMESLAGEATHPGEIPPALVRARARNPELVADRDAVKGLREALRACATQRAALLAEAVDTARAATDLDAHAPWRDDTRQALARWRALRTEAARYRAHGQALDGGWEGLERTASALEHALDRDALEEGLAEDWRAHERGATARGAGPYDHEGGDALLARLRAFAEAATPRGEVPPWLAGALTGHVAWTADRAAVRAAENALARCVSERETLLAEARRTRHALTDLPAHDACRARAEAALTGARALLAEERRYRAHLDESEAGWVRFVHNDSRVEHALDTDRRAGALLRDWHEHEAQASARGIASFYWEGYRDLMWRMESLAGEALRPGEIPPALVRARARNPELVAARDTVRGVHEALHACATRRAALLAEAVDTARAATDLDAHAPWRDDTRQALARWRALRTEAARYRAHGQALDGGWEELERTASALEHAFDRDALEEGLAEDWRAHVRGATARGAGPYDHEGCDALLARLRAFAEAATPRGEVPPWLAGALTRHDAWTADRAAVRAAENALARCVSERETLLAEARRTRLALTDLPAHDAWRVRAEAALTGARALLPEEGRYRAHLDESEAGWERFMRNGARVKRALGTDRRAGALLRDWHEHEARAGARGRVPFYYEGYQDLPGRMESLAGEATHPGEIPPALARALARHRELVAARDTVRGVHEALHACATRRAALLAEALEATCTVTDLDGYAPWRNDTVHAVADWRVLKFNEERYRVHGRALEGGWGDLEQTVAALERALDWDGRAEELREDWRDLRRRARERGRIEFYFQGYECLVQRLRMYSEAAHRAGELVPPWLTDALARHGAARADRARLERAAEALDASVAERGALLDEAGAAGQAVTDREGYAPWRKAAEAARDGAARALGDETRFGAHVRALETDGERLDAPLRALARGLDFDDRARGLAGRWAEHRTGAGEAAAHPFYHPGFDPLHRDIEALCGEAARAQEIPPALSEALALPSRLAEETRAVLQESETTRERLARESRTRAEALWELEAYAPWRQTAQRGHDAANLALAHAGRFAAHLDAFEDWSASLRNAAEAIAHACHFDAQGKALLLRRRQHGLDARRAAAPSALYTPWYGGFIEDLQAFMEGASDPMEFPAVLARDLDAHRKSVGARERAVECAGEVEQRARRRRVQLETAAAGRQALTEQEGYEALRKGADAAWTHAQALIDEAVTYRPHLDALEGGWEGFVQSAEALERALALDDRCDPLVKEWRAHEHAAAAAGVHPMDHEGCAGLVERMRALDAQETPAGDAPSPLAGLLAQHRQWEADRGTLGDLHTTLSGVCAERELLCDGAKAEHRAPMELDSYASWRDTAAEALARWREVRNDEPRYRPHAAAVARGGTSLEGAAEALERALALDDRCDPLVKEWRAHEHAAAAAGVHPMDHEGCAGLVERTRALDAQETPAGDAPSPLAGLLAQHRQWEADRGTLGDLHSTLSGVCAERELLCDGAKAEHRAPMELDSYASWRDTAAEALARWREVRNDEPRYRPHAAAVARGGTSLEGAAEALERALALDDRCDPLVKEWRAHEHAAAAAGVHPMDHEDCAGLVERMRALDAQETPAGDAPSPLAGLLAQHRQWEADRGTLHTTLSGACAERELLCDGAKAEHRAPMELDLYARWRDTALGALARWREVHDDEARYRPHAAAVARGGTSLESAAEALERALALDDRCDPLVKEWRAHEHAAAAAGVHPMDHEDWAGLVERMRALDAQETPAGDAPSPLAGLLAQHAEHTADRNALAEALDAVTAHIEERATLLARTRTDGKTIWDLEGNTRWYRAVTKARDDARRIIEDERRYRPHTAALHRSWSQFTEDYCELDASFAYDSRSLRLVREFADFTRRAEAAGVHPLYFDGHDPLLDRIEDHLDAARHPGEKQSKLIWAQKQRRVLVASRERVTRILPELEARIEERRRLAQEAGAQGRAPVEHPGYPHWHRRAQETATRSAAVRRERRYRPHVEATPQGGDSFTKHCAQLENELRRVVDFDERALGLCADWDAHFADANTAGRHPFYHEGHAGLMVRIDALAEEAGDPAEVPSALRAARTEHTQLVADRDAVKAAASTARASVEERDGLLEQAVREGTRPEELHPALEKVPERHCAPTERAPQEDRDHDRGGRRRR